MNRKTVSFLFLSAAIIMAYSGCAKISAPTGGPRDKLPPVVVNSTPPSGTINFKGKQFEIEFDEYVALDKISDKFMVSPPMKKKPKVFIKGKSVITEFEDILKDSTTYTFYYQDAIRDLNEANILENFQFVFSTGSVIDSLSVTGNVFNSFDLEVPEKAQVMMYRELADSAAEKNIPDYIANVNTDGYFRIDNVKAGKYRLYSLIDADNSRNYNLNDEPFAFFPTPVEVRAEKSYIPFVPDTTKVKPGQKKPDIPLDRKAEYSMFLYTALKKNHYLTSSPRPDKYQLIYTLSLPPGTMKFDFSIPGTASDKYLTERSRNNDTLKVWLTDSTLYSQTNISTLITYPSTDTLGITGSKTDTIPMRFIPPRAPRVARVKKPVLPLETNLSIPALRPGNKILFRTLTPLQKPDTTLIRLYEIIGTNRKTLPYTLQPDSTNRSRYFMNAVFAPEKKYLFVADSGAFSDIFGLSSDSLGYKFAQRDIESYCKLTLNITNFEGNHIIQLLSREEKVMGQVVLTKPGKAEFSLLETGFYRIRAIKDLNGDGKWTTGDFSKGQQPEPVIFYLTELELRTGNYLEQDWIMGKDNFKDIKLKEKRNSAQ